MVEKIKDTFDDYYSNSKVQNEYKINRISAIVILLLQFLSVIALVLNVMNILTYDNIEIAKIVVLLIPFTFSSFIIIYVLKIEKPWVKYYISIMECFIVSIIFVKLSMHAVILLILPVVKSCLYYDKKQYLITLLISSLLFLIAHILTPFLTINSEDYLASNLHNSLLHGFIPRYIQFIIISFIVFTVTNIGSRMMNSGYTHANNVDQLLSEQRKTHYEIVKNLATIAENKSLENGEHIERVFEYMLILAIKFGYDEAKSYNIGLAAMLHDVGKLGVDEKILSKPGKLTAEEFEIIKKHTDYGNDLLSNSNNEVLHMAKKIAYNHHERWDGNGYHGLKGNEIDRFSCMMSVIDVFDALTSKRCYKEAWLLKDAYAEIVKGRGTQFSPEVVDVFVSCFKDITIVYDKLNPASPNYKKGAQ